MPFGLLAGLGAALMWGSLDVITALTSRVVGSLRVTAGMQLVTAIVFVGLAIFTDTSLPSEPREIAIAALLGLIGAAAYLSYFTGLQIGPIAVVSGMVAAFGGLTVVLSVLFRGETLTPLQAIGASVATVGVILTGVAFDGGWRETRFASPGVVFAVIALVLFALMTMVTDIALETMDWIQLYAVGRSVNAGLSLAILAFLTLTARRMARRPTDGAAWSTKVVVGAITAAALLDSVGLIVFAIGLESAPTWMVGLAASFGPAVTILVAVAFLGERLKPIQWFGLAGIAFGMIAIALP